MTTYETNGEMEQRLTERLQHEDTMRPLTPQERQWLIDIEAHLASLSADETKAWRDIQLMQLKRKLSQKEGKLPARTIRLRHDGYDYIVPSPDGNPDGDYFTDDRRDAYDTARMMYGIGDEAVHFIIKREQ